MARKRFVAAGINGQWSSGVVLQTPTRIVLVKEDLGKEPILFKLPGGRRRAADNNPEDTAVREAKEETGISIRPEELDYVLHQDRGNHIYHLYTAAIDEERLGECFRVAKNGEEVHILEKNKLRSLQQYILFHHFKLLESINLAFSW